MKNHSPGKRKILKWIGIVAAILVILIGSISIYFSVRWKPVLTEKIKEVVYEGSKHLYRLDFKDIHLNVLTGSVSVDSILLAPDTAVFNSRKKAGTAPTHLFQVKLEKLQLRNIGILTVYFKKKIEMNDIILEHPSINMIYNKVYKKTDTTKDQRSLYERISKTLKSVRINGIKIADADFDYVSGASGELLHSVKHLNVQVKDLLLDAHSGEDSTRFYYTKDISFELAGYSALSKNKMYTTKIDTITGSASDKTIHIKKLKMVPMYSDLKFSRMLKYQKDRYDLTFDQINFTGVDFIRLNTEGVLHAHALTLKEALAKVFMNREMIPQNIDKTSNFPHMALKRLPIQTTIDTLKLKDVNVAYTEYNPITQERGTVHIDQLNGKILNVTNDSVSLAKNGHALATLSANMIKAAHLDIRIDFNLLSKNAAFTFNGNVGKMDMVKLNPLATALGLVKIKTGQVQKIDFQFTANGQGSDGTMHMYYTNLTVDLLKEGEDGAPVKKKGLLSFLANTILIKDQNPSKGEAVRMAKVHFERPRAASFFNLLWKSVFIGMRETVGLGIVPMKSPEEGRKVVVKKMEERKEKRADRNEARKERRAKRKAEKSRD
jgi:hypothetical protein